MWAEGKAKPFSNPWNHRHSENLYAYIYIYTSICLYIRQLYIAHTKTMASTLAAVGNVSNIGVSKNRRSFPLAVFPFILQRYVLFKMDLWVTVRKRPVLPRGTPHFATPPFPWVCFQADRQQLALMHPARWFHEYWSSGIKLSFPCLQPTTNNTVKKSQTALTGCLGLFDPW